MRKVEGGGGGEPDEQRKTERGHRCFCTGRLIKVPSHPASQPPTQMELLNFRTTCLTPIFYLNYKRPNTSSFPLLLCHKCNYTHNCSVWNRKSSPVTPKHTHKREKKSCTAIRFTFQLEEDQEINSTCILESKKDPSCTGGGGGGGNESRRTCVANFW